MISVCAPPVTVSASPYVAPALLSTVNASPLDVVTLASREEPSISKAVPVDPALIVTLTSPAELSVAPSTITSFSTFVTFAPNTAVVASPVRRSAEAKLFHSSSMLILIVSVPALPSIVSSAVNDSVASNVYESSEDEVTSLRLPAQVAVILSAVVINDLPNESSPDEIVQPPAKQNAKPGLLVITASLSVMSVPSGIVQTSVLLIVDKFAAVRFCAPVNVTVSVPAPPSMISVP